MRATVDPLKVGVAVSDILAGLYAVIAILGALHHRQSSGVGQHGYRRQNLHSRHPSPAARWVGAITKPNHAYSNACCAREGHSNVAAIFVSGGSVILWATPEDESKVVGTELH